MNYILLTSRYPFPSVGGDKLRAAQIVESLESRGHQIIVVSFYEQGLRRRSQDVLVRPSRVEGLWNALVYLFSRRPVQMAIYRSKRVSAICASYQRQGYRVICHLARMYDNIPTDGQIAFVDLCDALSLSYSQIGRPRTIFQFLTKYYEQRAIANAERRISKTNTTVVISKRDQNVLGEHVRVIPNYVDLPNTTAIHEFGPNVVFLANFLSNSNRDGLAWFLRSIWPHVLEAEPEIALKLVGNGSRELDRPQENVIGYGEFKNYSEAFTGAFLSICPLRFSSGLQNKVLVSLAYGIPVATTPEVAESFRGMEISGLYCALSTRDFSDQIIQLFRRRKEARLSKNDLLRTLFAKELVSRQWGELID